MRSLSAILRRHYLLLAVGPLALAGMLLGAYFMLLSLNAARDVEGLRAAQTGLRVQDAMDRLFSSLRDAQLRQGVMSMGAKERREVLLAFMAAHPMVRELTLVCSTGGELLMLSDYLPDRVDAKTSWHGRPEFDEPLRSGRIYVSGVTVHPDSGAPGLTVSTPFIDLSSGKPHCVVVLHLDLGGLMRVIAGYSLLPGETIYLADAEGRIVVHPNTSLALGGVTADQPGRFGLALAPENGEPRVRAVSALHLGEQRFLVVADRSLYEALGPAMNGATLLTALLCSAAGLAFILAAKSREIIERPLARLTETAHAIGDGQPGRRALAGGYVEADILARAFNEMTDRLERAREVLELEMAERAKTQCALERSQALLSLHLDTTPVGCIFFDLSGRITAWNPAAERIFGWTRQEVLSAPGASILLHPEDHDRMFKIFLDILEHGKAIVTNRNRTKDGRTIICEWHSSRLTEDGEVVGVASLVLDVTARLAAERRLRKGLREKETLLQEVHHRVKNNMQIISSLLNLQADKGADPLFRQMVAESVARIRSMALVHEKLYRSQSMSEVDLAGYLETLVGKLAASLGEGGRFVAEVKSEPIRLAIGQAVPVGLIVNELVTNAFKHAFADRASGRVMVSAATEGSFVTLAVSDDGVGLPPDFSPKQAQGLGWQIITGLTAQLGGRLVVGGQGEGAHLTVTFPMQTQDGHAPRDTDEDDADPLLVHFENAREE